MPERPDKMRTDDIPMSAGVVVNSAIQWAEEWGSWADMKDTVEWLNRYYPCRYEESENAEHYRRIFSYLKGKKWFGALARIYAIAPDIYKTDIAHAVLESQSMGAILWLADEAAGAGNQELYDVSNATAVLLGGKAI